MSSADEPGHPAVPMDLVVDAGVALKWYVPESLGAEAKRLLNPAFALHVPELFFAEFGNIVWKKARLLKTPELTVEEGREILALLTAVPMTAYPVAPLLEAAYTLATGPTRLTVYDCCYLALAIVLEGRLVTADRPFYDAHQGRPYDRYFLWVADPVLRRMDPFPTGPRREVLHYHSARRDDNKFVRQHLGAWLRYCRSMLRINSGVGMRLLS